MKKWVVGLLIVLGVLVVVAVAAGTVFYLRVYKPLFSANTAAGASRILEGRIVNKASYTPPASGELTAEQVASFVAIEQRVERRLGSRLSAFREQSEALAREPKGPTSRVLRRTLGELTGPYVQAKETLVEALNDQGLSLEEYEWIRRQVYGAAGLTFAHLDIQDLLADEGDLERIVRIRRSPSPQGDGGTNRQLVAPHADDCARWLPLAFFGL